MDTEEGAHRQGHKPCMHASREHEGASTALHVLRWPLSLQGHLPLLLLFSAICLSLSLSLSVSTLFLSTDSLGFRY